MKSSLYLIIAGIALTACTSNLVPSKHSVCSVSTSLQHVSLASGSHAAVIDGNSPDPDNIGATPVLLARLDKAEAANRLVDISHTCDLDPLRNKARYQIDPENESRRQTQSLFTDSGTSNIPTEFF